MYFIPSHRGIRIDALFYSGLYPSMEFFYVFWKEKHNLPCGPFNRDILLYKKTIFWWYMTILGMAVVAILAYQRLDSVTIPIILLALNVGIFAGILKKQRAPLAAFVRDFSALELHFPDDQKNEFRDVWALPHVHPTIEGGLCALARAIAQTNGITGWDPEDDAGISPELERMRKLAEIAKHRFGIIPKPVVKYLREHMYEETAP